MRKTFHVIYAIIAITILCTPEITAKTRYKGTGIVAHRGFWNCEEAGYAKNSLAALKCAQEAGFYGSEFDVNMTADSVLIVFHDGKVDGKKIEKHKYEEFKYYRLCNGEPIPTLDQYLEQGKKYPRTLLVYELKPHSCNEVEDLFIDLTIQKLKEYRLLNPSKVAFISFSYHICKRLAEILPDFTVQYLSGNHSPEKLASDGISGLDYHHSILKLNRHWTEKAHELDMSTNAWTVNHKDDMKAMFRQKVNMITTDYPLVARELMNELDVKELK